MRILGLRALFLLEFSLHAVPHIVVTFLSDLANGRFRFLQGVPAFELKVSATSFAESFGKPLRFHDGFQGAVAELGRMEPHRYDLAVLGDLDVLAAFDALEFVM
jgi:hypothetical protein